jgi:hypothetical protein
MTSKRESLFSVGAMTPKSKNEESPQKTIVEAHYLANIGHFIDENIVNDKLRQKKAK